MKKFLQKRLLSVFISIFVVLATCCGFFSNKVVLASAEQDKWTYSDCEEVISFIENNFSRFVLEYNKTVGEDEKLTAVGIEHTKIIWLVEDKNHGCYIDFIGNKGYVVVTGDYNIYDIQVVGDYPELRTVQDILFSYIDGFAYYSNDSLVMVDDIQKDDVEQPLMTAYAGQAQAGDGYITNIGNYVADRYPTYSLVASNESLANSFEGSYQEDTSWYYKYQTDTNGNIDGKMWTEGNCALNAVYSVMQDWQKKGFLSNLPTGTEDIRGTIVNDLLYDYYGTSIVRSDGGLSYLWKPSFDSVLEKMPILYSVIRQRAITQYGYTPESGFSTDNILDLIEYVANTLYGNAADINEYFFAFDAATAINQKAYFLSIHNSVAYGNHGVAFVGYRKYSYKDGWWIFAQTNYAYFYQIFDGHTRNNGKPVYFDPNVATNLTLRTFYLV